MHINTESFLSHMDNERNILCFKKTPDFRNVKEREEGEITVYLAISKDNGMAVDNAVAILQKLHDNYWEAHGIEKEMLQKVTDVQNYYLYVDTEKRRIGYKSNVIIVTLPFVAARGFAETITYIVGKCIEIHYDKTLSDGHEVIEDKDESSIYPNIMRSMNIMDDRQKDFEKIFKERIERKSSGAEEMESKKSAASVTVTKVERYKVKRFRTTEDLVVFLNRHNIDKSNIVDIQHKWFSHVLIYTYEKEVIYNA